MSLRADPDWLLPQWPAPSRVRSVFTTRAGGVSKPPYDSLNLGSPSSDDPAAIADNRRRFETALGAPPVFLSQVHGTRAVELTAQSQDVAESIEADACVSATPGTVCTVRVADCLPVLLTDERGTVVCAAHAGWRGLAAGLLENGFRRLEQVAHGQATDRRGVRLAERTLAWLGPCIGPEAFEVGSEVRAAFVALDAGAQACFVPKTGDKWMADLARLARRRLGALGITQIYGNDGAACWCTVGNPSRFFSHRRDSAALGGSGRMACCIWIDDS